MLNKDHKKIVILDRNAIIFLREWKKGTFGGNVARYARLRRLDRHFTMVTPMLSIWEGRTGIGETAEEKLHTIDEEAEVVQRFFRRATTDGPFFDAWREMAASAMAEHAEEKFPAYLQMVSHVQKTLYQAAAKRNRKCIQNALIEMARKLEINLGHPILLSSLAQLHGSQVTQKIFKGKPNIDKPEKAAYNATVDILALSRITQLQAAINSGGEDKQITLSFLTFDENLEKLIAMFNPDPSSCLAFDDGRVSGVIKPSRMLFPDLDFDSYYELMCELGGYETSSPRNL